MKRPLSSSIHLPATSSSQRHVLVVGGAGYVGSVLVRELLAQHYTVTVLDNLLYGHGAAIADLIEHPHFTFLCSDFRDEDVLHRALHEATDVVLLAALVGDPICKKYPEEAKAINRDGALMLLETLDDFSIDRFVFTSTCSNYGLRSSDEPATEEADLNPQSLYAETKVAVERHILEHSEDFAFSPTILRLATAYGISPRMRFDLTIAEFCRTLALGQALLVYDEHTWRPYCHIADIAAAIIRVLESPRESVAGEVFNVGSDSENYTKQMVVDVNLREQGDGDVRYHSGGSDPRNYRVSFDKIKKALDFTPRHTVPAFTKALGTAIQNGLYADVERRPNFYGNREIAQFELAAIGDGP